MKIGDPVECKHDEAWQAGHRASDQAKARKLGHRFHMGRAAAYMHLDEAYIVVGFTNTDGVQLQGFAPQVSPDDLRPSTKPVYR